MTDGPLLWYLNRGTGIVLLVLFTIVTVLGVLSTGTRAGRRVPAFVSQALHRNIALTAIALLAAHIISAVVDTFVDIRWWQALVPWWDASYQPLWLGFGTLAFDLIAVVAVTGLLRHRMTLLTWRAIHVTSYAAFAMALAHGVGIGTDMTTQNPWGLILSGVCGFAVLVALAVRLARRSFRSVDEALL